MAYLIGFILFGILFCECVFDNDLCENDILKNGFKCELKDANDCEYGELLYGLSRPTLEPIDTPPTTTIDLINSGAGFPENLDLKYIFGLECNGIEFDCNVDCENIIFENENENDYYGLYYPTIYATTHSTPRSSTTTINFNNTDLELCEKFILDGVYGCNMHGIY